MFMLPHDLKQGFTTLQQGSVQLNCINIAPISGSFILQGTTRMRYEQALKDSEEEELPFNRDLQQNYLREGSLSEVHKLVLSKRRIWILGAGSIWDHLTAEGSATHLTFGN